MFPISSVINQGAMSIVPMGNGMAGGYFPGVFTTPEEEMLACRKTAWFGIALSCSPVCDISGTGVVEMLNHACVNRDFGKLKIGGSRHVIMCNDKGQIVTDGVLMRVDETTYRSYWLSPMLEYYIKTSGLDVQYHYALDDFTFQIDGPKSLEIMENAAQTDLHSLKFGHNTHIEIAGVPLIIHRLGMSGALAYEVHGDLGQVDKVYSAILEAGKEFGIVRQGYNQYCLNHTQAGYPNQAIHYWYPYLTSGAGLKEFIENCQTIPPYWKIYPFAGSASDDSENGFVTPFDVKWDYLIDWDHDFVGKPALEKMKEDAACTPVTLEWDEDDIGKVFAAQLAGAFPSCDDISTDGDAGKFPIMLSKVMSDGKMVGVASGRTHDFYHKKVISLAWVEKDLAAEGAELVVIWGTDPSTAMEIKARVACFPYYNEEYRNETCDVDKLVPKKF